MKTKTRQTAKFICCLLVSIFVVSVFLIPSKAFANTCGGAGTNILSCDIGGDATIWYLINIITTILTAGVGALAVIGIILSGLTLLSARDDPDQVRKAKKRLFDVVVGVVIWGLLWVLIQFLIPGGVLSPNAEVDSISITVGDSMHVDEIVQITVEITPENAYDKSYSTMIEDRTIASVVTGGAKCERAGTTTVTVMAVDGKTASAEITCLERIKPEGSKTKPGTENIDSVNGTFSFNGMDYLLNIPENATNNMPIIVFLHGRGEVGDASAVSNLYQTRNMFSRTDFISIVPVAPSYGWEDKTTLVKGIIDSVINEYGADTDRIYIWGFSMGGRGTFHMVNTYTTFFSATTVVSNCPATGDSATNLKLVPLRLILGSADADYSDYHSCMTTIQSQINNLGGTAIYEEIAGATHATTSGALDYDSIFSWLLNH